MQIHELQPFHPRRKKKRVGRGGKRGTFSGKGTKGQKSRAGASVKPGFRGGGTPLWKVFPKQRGAGKKVEIKRGSPNVLRKSKKEKKRKKIYEQTAQTV